MHADPMSWRVNRHSFKGAFLSERVVENLLRRGTTSEKKPRTLLRRI